MYLRSRNGSGNSNNAERSLVGITGGHIGIMRGHVGIAGGHIGIVGGHVGIAGGHIGIVGGHIGIVGGHNSVSERSHWCQCKVTLPSVRGQFSCSEMLPKLAGGP